MYLLLIVDFMRTPFVRTEAVRKSACALACAELACGAWADPGTRDADTPRARPGACRSRCGGRWSGHVHAGHAGRGDVARVARGWLAVLLQSPGGDLGRGVERGCKRFCRWTVGGGRCRASWARVDATRAILVERTCFRVLSLGAVGPGGCRRRGPVFVPAGTSGRYGYYNIATLFDAR